MPELGTSPEQGQGPAAGLPKDLGIGNEVIRGVLPVQQAQGEAIDLLGQVITDVAATANNQMTIIQKLRLMEQNTRRAVPVHTVGRERGNLLTRVTSDVVCPNARSA